MIHIYLVALIAVGISSSAMADPTSAPKPPKLSKCDKKSLIETNVTVTKIVDGDTIWVQAKSGVYSTRLLGIDTPETHFMGKTQGKWGDEAATYTQRLLPIGTAVTLGFGPEACDDHGRLLANIFVGKMHVNEELVREGLAVNYCVAPTFENCENFSNLVHNAIAQKKGMFSDPTAELPYDFRRRVTNKEQRSYVGSIRSKEVLKPGNQNKIPVADRVFFYTPDMIQTPYRLVD